MRNTNRVFSAGERKAVMWVLIATAMLVIGSVAYDRLASPSLGIYGQEFSGSLPGVLDARPLS